MDKMPFTFGSLFSGVGGLDLGFERAGFKVAWQVEIDDYATKILTKHWPNTPRFRDVRAVGKHNLAPVDLIAGGFPCQDISDAGKQAGIDGERSGLWAHFYRLIRELRPRYVVVENVAALLHRGMDRVLGDLAACGYDAEWQIISAESVGAPHVRERVFIVAYTTNSTQRVSSNQALSEFNQRYPRMGAYGSSDRQFSEQSNQALAYTDFQSLEIGPCFGRDAHQKLTAFERDCSTGTGQWAIEPGICRVADGVPHRVDRLRGLGNAVVPQVAEFVGRCIMAAEAERQVLA